MFSTVMRPHPDELRGVKASGLLSEYYFKMDYALVLKPKKFLLIIHDISPNC